MPNDQMTGWPTEESTSAYEDERQRLQESTKASEVSRPSDLVGRSVHLRAVREEAREADFVFSTSTIDRYGEIVEQVWQLEHFHANPVALFGHKSGELPVGFAKDVGVVDGQLRGTIRFVSADANPKAEQVWQSIREGSLRAVSVGFVPHETRWETREDREVLVLSQNELWEISVVPIPANPEALARMRARAVADAMADVIADVATHLPGTERGEPSKEATVPEKSDPTVAPSAAEAELKAKSDALDAITLELENERSKRSALELRCADLETARTSQQERADAYELELVERDISGLVGTKLTAAEKPGLLALFTADRDVYAQQLDAIKARPDMPQARKESALGADPAPPAPTASTNDPGAELAAAAAQRMNRNRR